MLIDNVELCSNNLARRIPLAFRDPNSSLAYQLKAIQGLDADEILTKFTGNPNGNPKTQFRVPTITKREVVLSLGLNPWLDPQTTYSSLRDTVYKVIAGDATGSVKLYFNYGDDTIAALTGYITKIEASHFTKTPEMQITIDCSEEPLLKALEPIAVPTAGLLHGRTATINDDYSTSMHGFKFAVRFEDSSPNFSISDGEWFFVVSYPFVAGDRLYVSSELNDKSVYRVRGGAAKHLGDKIGPNSIWAVMLPGENVYTFSAAHGVTLLSLSYYPTYLGV